MKVHLFGELTREFQMDISTNSREIKYRNIEIWVYAFYMLNVAHIKNDIK